MIAPPPGDGAPSPLDLLRDKRAIVDTTVAPLAFLLVNAIAGLRLAAAVAVAIAVVLLLERAVRRAPVTNALGGLLGTGLAVFIALRTGSVEGYFVPRAIQNAAFALAFAGSVIIRRPLIGLLAQGLVRYPSDWIRDRRVRRAFSEATLAWTALFAIRATVYTVLIALGKAEYLGLVVLVLGWPAFALLVFGTFRYVPRRLEQLGAPDGDAAKAAAAASAG